MTDHELHTLTGAYAADALDTGEREAFEGHLGTCASCRAEVDELQATTARLAADSGTAPPAGLRARVLAEVALTRQLSPHADVVRLDERRRDRPWYRQPAAAAAALLLLVATGLGGLAAVERSQKDDARRLADRIAAVAADPDRSERTVPVGAGGTGTVVAAHGIAVFHGTDLPRLPDGRAYQLWRISGQESQSAGVLGRGGELTGVVTGLAAGDSVGVTVEPSSGSDRPTSDPVFLVSPA
jgi:anti-sigma-K factor RskA